HQVGRDLKQVRACVAADVVEAPLAQQPQVCFLQDLVGVFLRRQKPCQIAIQRQPVLLEQLAREFALCRRQPGTDGRRRVPGLALWLVVIGLRRVIHRDSPGPSTITNERCKPDSAAPSSAPACAAAANLSASTQPIVSPPRSRAEPEQYEPEGGTMITIRAACALLSLVCLTAHAAEGVSDRLRTQTRFDIPAQALGTSLKQLAEQAGVQILFEEDMVRGLSAPALKAQQSVEQALHVLLGNTGLVYVASGDAIAVRKAFKLPSESTTPPPAGRRRLRLPN